MERRHSSPVPRVQAREKQRNNADLFMVSAAVQRRQGRWAGSIADFEKTVQLNTLEVPQTGQYGLKRPLGRAFRRSPA
jgi:hypothetical protein